LQNYGVALLVAAILIGVFTSSRTDSLQSMRTSTSTTLDVDTGGTAEFVRQAARLFRGNNDDGEDGDRDEYDAGRDGWVDAAQYFEAPTVIRYEEGQVLAPHYDANRSAQTEDANRGGQTLATLILYLNDVKVGGWTRFGKLDATAAAAANNSGRGDGSDGCDFDDGNGRLVIRPKRGDALLFFPADRFGTFDPRTEHEGMPAVDEKWIARIWRHERRVPPPFGLSETALNQL
jgi:2OG-Fe(II) oxygenase superfamily